MAIMGTSLLGELYDSDQNSTGYASDPERRSLAAHAKDFGGREKAVRVAAGGTSTNKPSKKNKKKAQKRTSNVETFFGRNSIGCKDDMALRQSTRGVSPALGDEQVEQNLKELFDLFARENKAKKANTTNNKVSKKREAGHHKKRSKERPKATRSLSQSGNLQSSLHKLDLLDAEKNDDTEFEGARSVVDTLDLELSSHRDTKHKTKMASKQQHMNPKTTRVGRRLAAKIEDVPSRKHLSDSLGLESTVKGGKKKVSKSQDTLPKGRGRSARSRSREPSSSQSPSLSTSPRSRHKKLTNSHAKAFDTHAKKPEKQLPSHTSSLERNECSKHNKKATGSSDHKLKRRSSSADSAMKHSGQFFASIFSSQGNREGVQLVSDNAKSSQQREHAARMNSNKPNNESKRKEFVSKIRPSSLKNLHSAEDRISGQIPSGESSHPNRSSDNRRDGPLGPDNRPLLKKRSSSLRDRRTVKRMSSDEQLFLDLDWDKVDLSKILPAHGAKVGKRQESVDTYQRSAADRLAQDSFKANNTMARGDRPTTRDQSPLMRRAHTIESPHDEIEAAKKRSHTRSREASQPLKGSRHMTRSHSASCVNVLDGHEHPASKSSSRNPKYRPSKTSAGHEDSKHRGNSRSTPKPRTTSARAGRPDGPSTRQHDSRMHRRDDSKEGHHRQSSVIAGSKKDTPSKRGREPKPQRGSVHKRHASFDSATEDRTSILIRQARHIAQRQYATPTRRRRSPRRTPKSADGQQMNERKLDGAKTVEFRPASLLSDDPLVRDESDSQAEEEEEEEEEEGKSPAAVKAKMQRFSVLTTLQMKSMGGSADKPRKASKGIRRTRSKSLDVYSEMGQVLRESHLKYLDDHQNLYSGEFDCSDSEASDSGQSVDAAMKDSGKIGGSNRGLKGAREVRSQTDLIRSIQGRIQAKERRELEEAERLRRQQQLESEQKAIEESNHMLRVQAGGATAGSYFTDKGGLRTWVSNTLEETIADKKAVIAERKAMLADTKAVVFKKWGRLDDSFDSE